MFSLDLLVFLPCGAALDRFRFAFYFRLYRGFVTGYGNFLDCGRTERSACTEHGERAVQKRLHRFNARFAFIVVAVILRCGIPQRQHHILINLLNPCSVIKLLAGCFNFFPVFTEAHILIRTLEYIRCIVEERANFRGKLLDLVIWHCCPVIFGQELIIGD